MTQPTRRNPRVIINRQLDADFNRQMADLMRVLRRDFGDTGEVGLALRDLQNASGPDRRARQAAALRAVESATRRAADVLDAKAISIQEAAIKLSLKATKLLTLGESGEAALMKIGYRWNSPDPAAMARMIQYVSTPEFQAELDNIPDAVMTFARGAVQKLSAAELVEALGQVVPKFAQGKAMTLARTLQLTAFRDATAMGYIANARILEPNAIRIAARDERTCPACLALHGTPVPIGQRVHDHHNGRCTSVAVVKGTTRNVEPGVAWFERQPAAMQQKILGNAGYRAWKSGAVALSDYVQPRSDPLWGEMIEAASLKGLLGEQAAAEFKKG